MTKQEREVKEQVVLANMENDILKHLQAISEITNDAWSEIEDLTNGERSYTEFHVKVVQMIRKYGFC